MSGRQSPRGLSVSPAANSAVRCTELKSLPPLPSGAIFKPFNLEEPTPDEFSLGEGILISFLTGIAFVAAVVLLFFKT